jgi:hypothetical protein
MLTFRANMGFIYGANIGSLKADSSHDKISSVKADSYKSPTALCPALSRHDEKLIFPRQLPHFGSCHRRGGSALKEPMLAL